MARPGAIGRVGAIALSAPVKVVAPLRQRLVNPHPGWPVPFNIYREVSGAISTDLDITKFRPAPAATYYVDPARPDNAGDGLTWATALRDVSVAVLKAGDKKIIVRAGRYLASYGWFNAIGVTSIQIEVENNGEAWFINSPLRTYPVWTLDQGTTYATPNTSNNLIFADFNSLDADGNPSRLARAASIAAVRATPGSFYNDGTNYYCNAGDKRALVGDQNMVLLNPTNNVRWAPASTGLTLSLKNIHVVGGRGVWTDQSAVGAARATSLFEGCRFVCGNTGSGANGLSIGHAGMVISLNCHAAYNEADGFNEHGQVSATPNTPSPDVYEIGCTARQRNGYAGSTSSPNNATTAHESTRILRINGRYGASEGRVCADIDLAKMWSLGCLFGASLSNGASGQAVQNASANAHYMDSCVISRGLSSVDVSVSNANGLRLFNTSLAGLTVDNPGNVALYTPQFFDATLLPIAQSVNAFSPIKTKLAARQNAVLFINGDSTAYSDYGPLYKFATALGDLHDATVILRRWAEWDGVAATGPKAYADPVTLRTGAGPQLSVYLAALPGAVAGQLFDASRRGAAIDAIPTPDLAILHHGHNMQSFEVIVPGVNHQGRGVFLGPIGMTSLVWPNTPQVVTTQNPWRDNTNYDKVYTAIVEVGQALPSLTVVNTHDDFVVRGKLSTLYRDNIHPSDSADNSTGAALVAARLFSDFNSALTGAFTTTSWPKANGTNLIANGDMTPWTAAVPTGWASLSNGAASKDATNVYPGQGFSWSAAVTPNIPTGNQNSGLYKPFSSTERTAIAGKTVSVAVLVKVDPDQRSPYMALYARSAGALRAFPFGGLVQCRDGWMWYVAAGIPVDAATATDGNTSLRIYPGFGGSPPTINDALIVQRAVIVEGNLPAGLMV